MPSPTGATLSATMQMCAQAGSINHWEAGWGAGLHRSPLVSGPSPTPCSFGRAGRQTSTVPHTTPNRR